MTADPHNRTVSYSTTGFGTDLEDDQVQTETKARLAEAEALLAETQLCCSRLVDDAREQAHRIVAEARSAARRILAQAEARHTGVDTRPRSSASFSELWAVADEDHDLDSFFLNIPQREASDVFSA